MKIPKEAKIVFEGKIFTIYQWEQKLYDGSFATFEMAKRRGTAMVIPVLDNGKILLTKQSQPTKGEYIDFVGGGQEKGHTLLETAHKEMLEETGYTADSMELLFSEDLGGSKMEYENAYYIARDCKKVAEQDLDAGEKLETFEVSVEDFLSLDFEKGVVKYEDFVRVIEKIKSDEDGLQNFIWTKLKKKDYIMILSIIASSGESNQRTARGSGSVCK